MCLLQSFHLGVGVLLKSLIIYDRVESRMYVYNSNFIAVDYKSASLRMVLLVYVAKQEAI